MQLNTHMIDRLQKWLIANQKGAYIGYYEGDMHHAAIDLFFNEACRNKKIVSIFLCINVLRHNFGYDKETACEMTKKAVENLPGFTLKLKVLTS